MEAKEEERNISFEIIPFLVERAAGDAQNLGRPWYEERLRLQEGDKHGIHHREDRQVSEERHADARAEYGT